AMLNGGTLTLQIQKKTGQVAFAFTDTGMGMPEEVRLKVFEPFFTRGKQHGTGLGLAIVKKIVDDHNGSIEINTEVGKGTTVRIILPLT
ncbi:MAG: ATP-binding protein, partial [Bacteroidota bacterium]